MASGDVRAVEVHNTAVAVQGRVLAGRLLHDVTERERAAPAWRLEDKHLNLTHSHVERIANFAQIEALQLIFIYREQSLADPE